MSSVEYETPNDFFQALDAEFNFVLDVCATRENTKCTMFFSPEDNGLAQCWKGVCWMNPPYDKNIGAWLKKAYEASRKDAVVVCLIQGRSTDTKWWHEYVMKAREIRFIKDRLHFGMNKVFRRANISSVIVVFHPAFGGPPLVSAIDTKGRQCTSPSP